MEAPLWLLLVIALVLGGLAALVSQLTAARKTIEANAKARSLRESVDGLVARNAARRDDLRKRRVGEVICN